MLKWKKTFTTLLASGLLLLSSCTGVSPNSQAESMADRVFVPKLAEAEKSIVIEKPAYEYREFRYLSAVTYNMVDHAVEEPTYSDPTEYYKTDKGDNGGTQAGTLTISGDIENRGFYRPASSFHYTSISVGTNARFNFRFHSIASYSGMDSYEITSCTATSLFGYSLGAKIGKGAVLILKKRASEANWSKVDTGALKIVDLSNNADVAFKPLSDDIMRGTYFRFISAYQYRYKESDSFVMKKRRYYDVAQVITVFLGRDGLSIKFAASTTPEQTHEIPSLHYEGAYDGTSPIELIPENLKTPTIPYSQQDGAHLGKFSLKGETIKGSENELGLEKKTPVYVYNGVKEKVSVEFSNNMKYFAQASSITGVKSGIKVETTHNNKGVKSAATVGDLAGISSGAAVIIQGLKKEKNNYSWVTIKYSGVTSTSNLSLEIGSLVFAEYESFRAMVLVRFLNNQFEAMVSYFDIKRNLSRYQGLSEMKEGHDSTLLAYTAASTLGDESVCFSSFSVDKIVDSYKVEYAYNNQAYQTLTTSTKTFDQAGKYRFRVTNIFNEVEYTTIYLMAIHEDNGLSQYFSKYGGFLDEGKRVYDPSVKIPSYGQGTPFFLNASQDWPGVYVSINYVYPDGTMEELQSLTDLHAPLEGVFSELGQYRVEIDTSNPTSAGDHVHYTVNFRIVDPTPYTPKVNQDFLFSGIFTSSFITKVYSVTLQSAGVGSFVYVFPYDENGEVRALDTALAIEAKSVVEDNGHYLYQGATYESKFAVYEAMQAKAIRRIGVNYISQADLLTEGEEVGEVSSETVLEKDVYLVPSQEDFKLLVGTPVLLNGFSFTQLREYESSSVYLTSPSGELIPVDYDVNLSSILTETGMYTISETNWCGTSTYQAAFIAPGEVTYTLNLRYASGGKVVEVGAKAKGITAGRREANAFYFASIEDELDPYGYVTVAYDNQSQRYSYEELAGKLIDVNGSYTLTFTNRLGYTGTQALLISGGKESGDVMPHVDLSNPLSYVAVGGEL